MRLSNRRGDLTQALYPRRMFFTGIAVYRATIAAEA